MPLLMCPNCQASMQTVTRSGVEFDMCAVCRGVWLDRGELEKLVTLSRDEPYEQRDPGHYGQGDPGGRVPQHGYYDRRRGEDGGEGDLPTRGRRRCGFDIFDIFD